MALSPWRIAGLVLLAVLVSLQAAAFYYGFRVRREATGTFSDAERSLRETNYRDEAIILFRAENEGGAVRFAPAACLRMPKGRSEFAWRKVALDELRNAAHCQGAIAFAGPDERAVYVAYIYDGIVGLPTDLAVSVTLADFLAAVGAVAR